MTAASAAARKTALLCGGVVVLMTAASFAAVPLYDLFCKVTGFGGTPLTGTAGAGRMLDRTMEIRFDANVAPQLGWRFVPEQPGIVTRIGRTETVFYTVTNRSDRPATAIATFNVQPAQAGAHFVKLQCFCFTEHTLQPGESLEAPVVFYIDPDIETNRELDKLRSITLSYTYFSTRGAQPAVAGKSVGDDGKPKL